ncbi:ADYC domain-containing protein [Nannocystis sp. SCPEA4]|uniref:ADYC domain-containing protein n=1 Tax=Nannocystis sp. SCPEA4 TaxID=2996787 RepID=UPI0022704F8B|nr:ADYC domain-containing protein [Nannocystis sp. SCPEA4]MCY1059770.1 ADYC domain-containing protein [Nannocystis sp. SCPEA4]
MGLRFGVALMGACLSAGGCIEEMADAELLDEDVAMRDGGSTTCPVWRCGFNSAEVNGRAIRELNLDGLANADGMRIVGFVAPLGLLQLQQFKLGVEKGELVARSQLGTTLRGNQLIGATILVAQTGSLLPQVITVLGHQKIDSWAEGAPQVSTYTLVYPDVNALLGMRNVCTGDLLDAVTSAVTVIGGETYDLETKTIQPDRPRWMTLACAGSAAAKLQLMNYGPQSNFDGAGHPASLAQRQATLRMITADYCGDGHSYTENGTALSWENAGGTVVSPGELGALEAVWSANGALCLETPRLGDPDVACDLPACDGFSLEEGEWVTYVPGA